MPPGEDCVWKVVAPVAGTRLDPCGAQSALSFQPPKLGLGPTTWQQQRGPTHLCCTSEGEKGVRHLKVRKVQSVQPPLQPGDPWRAHEFARWLVLAVSGSERQLGPLREGHRDVLPFNHMSHHSHVVFGWLEHRTRRVWCTEAGRNPSQKWWQDDLGLVRTHGRGSLRFVQNIGKQSRHPPSYAQTCLRDAKTLQLKTDSTEDKPSDRERQRKSLANRSSHLWSALCELSYVGLVPVISFFRGWLLLGRSSSLFWVSSFVRACPILGVFCDVGLNRIWNHSAVRASLAISFVGTRFWACLTATGWACAVALCMMVDTCLFGLHCCLVTCLSLPFVLVCHRLGLCLGVLFCCQPLPAVCCWVPPSWVVGVRCCWNPPVSLAFSSLPSATFSSRREHPGAFTGQAAANVMAAPRTF